MAKTDTTNWQHIRNLPDKAKNELDNIAANIGISRTQFLRKKLREKIAEYPELLKTETPEKKRHDIILKEFPQDLRKNIANISGNIGATGNSFLLMLLYEILQETSSEYKKPRKDEL